MLTVISVGFPSDFHFRPDGDTPRGYWAGGAVGGAGMGRMISMILPWPIREGNPFRVLISMVQAHKCRSGRCAPRHGNRGKSAFP